MKRPCNHGQNKDQVRIAEKLTVSLYHSDYQWLSFYFLRDWGLFKMHCLVLLTPQKLPPSCCPWCQRAPGTDRKANLCPTKQSSLLANVVPVKPLCWRTWPGHSGHLDSKICWDFDTSDMSASDIMHVGPGKSHSQPGFFDSYSWSI